MVVRRFGCVIRVLMQWLTRGGAAPQRRFREEVSKSAVYIIPTVDSYGGGAGVGFFIGFDSDVREITLHVFTSFLGFK
jgi:hypothetical protein